MPSTYLTRTFDQVGNRQKWTLSVWIKRTGIGGQQNFFGSFPQSTDYERIMFNNDKIYMSEVGGGSTSWEVETNAVYRDTNAWYHLVLRHDTTQSTANDRIRLYMNGVQQTFGTNTQPAQNRGTAINTADVHKIAMGYNSEYTDCVMSHFHWCDGQSYAPTEFGSTDSTTGEWKINTSPSVTYGTNGFFILKDGNSVTDQGGGSHNWTVGGGTLTKTEDNPSNVFCTVNPLDNYIASATLTNGNTTVATGSGNPSWNYITSTLGVSTGKWYWEVKDTTNNSSILGFAAKLTTSTGDQLGESSAQWGVQPNGRFRSAGSDLAGVGTFSFGQNDIVGIALDATNKKVYFHTNGTYGNSGNPSTGANGITIASPDVGGGFGWYFPAFGDGNTSSDTYHVNFGNGYFGTTAITSAGSNGNGSLFEYDVPTGYYALNTKNINTYG